MSERRFSSSNQATASSSGGGCLSGMLLPPLAVILIGAALAYLAFGPSNPLAAARDIHQGTTAQAGAAGRSISPIFTPQVQYWADQIQAWAAAAGLDPNLVATVMQIESCGNPSAVSSAGAMGLFQVMPYHFVAGENPYDPQTNSLRGLDYLRRSLEAAGGDARLALAGYNGGIGVIGQAEYTWSPQTQAYARRGSRYYADASAGVVSAVDMQDYQAAGESSLCRQAASRLGISP
jgi:soluble lytic murein transglycosylase-like protein